MSIGLILFTLADSTVQPEFNHTGELWHANIVMQCFYKGLYGNLAPHKKFKIGAGTIILQISKLLICSALVESHW